MVYIKNIVRFLTFGMAVLSIHSVRYMEGMNPQSGSIQRVKSKDSGRYVTLIGFIKMGEECNKCDESGNTPLMRALLMPKPSFEIIKYLVDKKSDVNVENKKNDTPLYIAIRRNLSNEIIECLEKNNKKVNSDKFHRIRFLSKEVIEYFLSYCEHKDMSLHEAVEKNDPSFDTIKYFIGNKLDLNVQDNNNDTPLHIAIRRNLPFEIIKCLVENKSDLNVQDNNHDTPLHKAIRRNLPFEIIKYLVENKADLSMINYSDNTPLYEALSSDVLIEIIQYLVDKKLDLNVQDEDENTVLHKAVTIGSSLEIIKYLIENKADLNLQNTWGDTPLCQALEQYNISIEIVKCLIDNKTDLNMQGRYQKAPLFIAINDASIEVVKYLIDNKSDINTKYNDMTFWKFLVKYSSRKIQTLNESGAIDFRVKDCERKTILDYAQGENCHKDILNLERKWRTPEETQQVKTFLTALYVLQITKSDIKFKVPKPILAIIFKLAGIPTHGKSIKLFDC